MSVIYLGVKSIFSGQKIDFVSKFMVQVSLKVVTYHKKSRDSEFSWPNGVGSRAILCILTIPESFIEICLKEIELLHVSGIFPTKTPTWILAALWGGNWGVL